MSQVCGELLDYRLSLPSIGEKMAGRIVRWAGRDLNSPHNTDSEKPSAPYLFYEQLLSRSTI